MITSFYSGTAEQVVGVIEAVVLNNKPTDIDFVQKFCDIPSDTAEAALNLSVELGFLKRISSQYDALSHLCRLLITSAEKQRAAVIRIQLESYRPFLLFRERLFVTRQADTAARQIKSLLDIDEHWEKIKDTLISLGTYSHALVSQGGGVYTIAEKSPEEALLLLVSGCQEQVTAEIKIREHIGEANVNSLSREDVILPLVGALVVVANQGNARTAILHAGNAIESFLNDYGLRVGADVSLKTGINAKIDELKRSDKMPTKISFIGKYLGHVRNGADHGIDPEIEASWQIRELTGLEYVSVACSFIKICLNFQNGGQPEL